MQSICLVGGGLIIEVNIPVQELEGQRGEGAYFRRGLIFGRIRYIFGSSYSTRQHYISGGTYQQEGECAHISH